MNKASKDVPNGTHAAFDEWFELQDKFNFSFVQLNLRDGAVKFDNILLNKLSIFFTNIVQHFNIVKAAYSQRKLIVAREFLTISMLPWLPFIFPVRHRVIFLAHHHCQESVNSQYKRKILRFYVFLGIKIAIPECRDDVVRDLRLRSAFEYKHPIPEFQGRQTRRVAQHNISIGVIGMHDNMKRTAKAMTIAEEIKRILPGINVELVHISPKKVDYKYEPWRWVDSKLRENYLDGLTQIDAAIFAYDEKYYKYRPSGVIAELIGCRKIVIAPNLPALQDILNGVGYGFDPNESEIKIAQAVVKSNVLFGISNESEFDEKIKSRSSLNTLKNLILQINK